MSWNRVGEIFANCFLGMCLFAIVCATVALAVHMIYGSYLSVVGLFS